MKNLKKKTGKKHEGNKERYKKKTTLKYSGRTLKSMA